MMRVSILLLLFVSSCSLTETEKKFVKNIAGTYCFNTTDEFTIQEKDKGDFIFKGVNYTLQTVFSDISATYLRDDVQYTGIFYRTAGGTKMRLTYLDSTDTTEDGVDMDSGLIYQFANKK